MNSKIKVKHPIAIQWKIAETRLQELKTSFNGYLISTLFNIPGTDIKYYARIYPNGDDEKDRGKTHIFFFLRFNDEKEIAVEILASIESANVSRKLKNVLMTSEGTGCSPCTVEELFIPEKRFIVDGEMSIKLEGFLMIEKEVPRKLLQLGKSGNNLCFDLWNHEFKDFTIVADGKEIAVHKLVLSVRSPVFVAMFQPHTMKAKENKVIVPDFSFDIVETAIKLCYDSRLVESIPIQNQILILQFFDKYDMLMLKIDLEEFMISEIDESNVCRLANCAILSNAPKLQKKCSDLLQKCLRANQLVNDFDILDKDFALDMVKNSLFKLSL